MGAYKLGQGSCMIPQNTRSNMTLSTSATTINMFTIPIPTWVSNYNILSAYLVLRSNTVRNTAVGANFIAGGSGDIEVQGDGSNYHTAIATINLVALTAGQVRGEFKLQGGNDIKNYVNEALVISAGVLTCRWYLSITNADSMYFDDYNLELHLILQ